MRHTVVHSVEFQEGVIQDNNFFWKLQIYDEIDDGNNCLKSQNTLNQF